MSLEAGGQPVHLVSEAQGIVQQAVVDGGGAAHQQVIQRVLKSDVAVGLGGQRILDGALDAGEAADQMPVHYAGADEGVAVVDVLHYYLVARLHIVGIGTVARARGLAELPCGVHREGGAGSDGHVEIRTEVVTVEKRPGVGAVVGYVLSDTFLAEVAEGYEVLHPVGSSANVQVGLVLGSHSVELFLVEVVVGIVEGRGVLQLLFLLGSEAGHSIHLLGGKVAVVLEFPEVVVVVDIGG